MDAVLLADPGHKSSEGVSSSHQNRKSSLLSPDHVYQVRCGHLGPGFILQFLDRTWHVLDAAFRDRRNGSDHDGLLQMQVQRHGILAQELTE